MTNIFLSTPMSVIAKDLYSDFRKEVIEIKNFFQALFPKAIVHYPGDAINSQENFDDPFQAFKHDIAALDKCTTFVFIYPEKTPTSALIELGYAIRMKVPIIIITPQRSMLPYMVQSLDLAIKNAMIIEFGSEEILSNIKQHRGSLKKFVV